MDPITYPSVVLDGTTLTLKVTLAALRRLREAGIDGSQPDPTDIAASSRYLAAHLGACSHVVRDGKLVWSGLSTADAEEIIEPRDIPKLRTALEEALVKATAAETSPPPPPGS